MKKIIKNRILTLLLAFIMILSIGIIPTAADGASDEKLQLTEFLNRIGISASSGEAGITRGDFTVLAVQAMNVGTVTDEVYFSDISGEQGKYINTAASIGIVSIDDEGLFNPDRVILREEAAAIALRVLGYDDIMEDTSYPFGYLFKASSLGLFNGIGNSAELTAADAVRLIYNMLNTEYVVLYQKNKDTQEVVYTVSDNIYLNEIFNVNKEYGTIHSICGLTLNNGSVVDSKKILIDNVVYDNPYYLERNNYLYLGKQVNFFTKETQDGVEVLYLESKTETLSIPAEDISSVKGFDVSDSSADKNIPTLSYYTPDSVKSETLKLDLTADIFVNGEPIVSVSNDTFMPEAGVIYLTDTDSDDYYDVIAIEQYTYYHVSKYDSNYGIVTDEQGKESISLYDFENGAIEYISGTKIVDENIITVGAVLEVMCSYLDNGQIDKSKFMRIRLCSGLVKGTVDYIDDERNVSINGESYRYLSSIDDEIRKQFGRKGTYYLGKEGFIVACDEFEGHEALKYAYLVDYGNDDSLDEKPLFLLYTLEGKMISVEAADRLLYTGMYNGSYVYGRNLKKEMLGDVIVKKELIKYELDKEGKLSLIHYALDRSKEENYIGYDDEHFSLDYKTNNCNSRSGWLESGHVLFSRTLTTCLYASTTSTSEADFTVGYYDSRGSSVEGKTLKVYDADYRLNGGIAVFEDVPVRDTVAGSKFFSPSIIWLVADKKTVLNSDGVPETQIDVRRGDSTATYIAVDNDLRPLNDIYYSLPSNIAKFSELEKGDVIAVATDVFNRISAYIVLHDYDSTHQTTDTAFKNAEYNLPYLADYRYVIGRVTECKEDSAIMLDVTGQDRFSLGRNEANYMIYNNKTGIVTRPSGTRDIYPGDYVYVYLNRTNVHMIVKYE